MSTRRLLPAVVALAACLLGAAAQADIVCNPPLTSLNQVIPAGQVVVAYTGGGTADVAGYSLEIAWDDGLATAALTRPDSGPFATAVAFFVVNLGPGHARVDAAIGGAAPGIAAGELLKVTFTARTGVSGSSAIDLTVKRLRDSQNLDVGVVAAVDGQLEVDTGAPTLTEVRIVNDTLTHTDDYVKDTDAVTVTAIVSDGDPGFSAANISADLTGLGGGAAVPPDSYAASLATWSLAGATCTPANGTVRVTVTATDSGANSASAFDEIIADNLAPTPLLGVTVRPGHERVHLAWADIATNDANPLGVEFRQAAWGAYPTYDHPEPDYPASHGDGLLALQTAAGTAADWPVLDRNIYYLAGFVYDMVLHYSAAGAANRGRATNYWLGDVSGPTGVDGVVDVAHDITQLADTYGLPDTDGQFDPDCDVGPTDTGSPRGIPRPNLDHEIGFEDMMIFALNYSVVTPSTKAVGGALPVLAWERVDGTTWALELVAGGGRLQGLNLRADLPGDVRCTVEPGALLADQAGPCFVGNAAARGLDAGLALFGGGAGFRGTGELVRVRLSRPLAGLEVSVSARGADNQELAVGLAGGDDLPGAPRFAQNFPNPFNPGTTLAFDLPQAMHVQLVIYGLDGARLRTLVDEDREAGRYEVYWDGRDDRGRSPGAGSYFARIVAGDFERIRKMTLLK